MSNDTTGNPWVLDTAGVIQTRPITIKAMKYTPTTAGDDLLVEDNAGHDIWKFKAVAADANEQIEYFWAGKDITFSGFNLTTIDHGTLTVYIE